MEHLDGKPCMHIWIEFDKEGVDQAVHYAKRVCHYCKADLGFEPHPREQTILGYACKLLDEGKLQDWQATVVKELSTKPELDASQRKILSRIVNEHRG